MNQEQQQLIYEAINDLPPDIKWSIEETAWEYVCPQIALRFELTEMQSSKLTTETGMYLSGIIEFEEFINELRLIFNSDPEQGKLVLKNIIDEIFEPFSQNLKNSKIDIKDNIHDLDTEIAELNSAINENSTDLNIPQKIRSAVFSIPIKNKESNEPVLTTKKEQNFSNIQKPSTYVSKIDPYHEEL